ncbi:hypothetical protein SEA_SONALI_47 [Arthrobacter phage Sonali]|uniref:RecT-like ssDNA binding protein n=1 Tax=Arthrobacter phage Sonali TaxID=2510495 RepID=A0A411CQE9_9CAUD|nr:RecT-like ssDNA annealing protein [Arthrobacter phage Sonali]QAY16159.1 hypothetical protein SEA_SONALI_47 [Arthrobacter phage Sonali]
MTELATIPETAPTASTVAAYVPSAQPGKQVDLDSYWTRMGTAIQIAGPMCKTPFVPAAFRNKPEDTAMAIMYGFKYGMEPDAALSSIFIIGGRPGMYSRVQHAILLAHGHDVRVTKQTPEECVVQGRRKGDEGEFTVSSWTIARARQAGYFTNDKYTKDPIAMLTARALGDVCRLVAPDLLMGIVAYNEADVEVMEVLDGDTLRPIQEQPTARVQRRVAAAPPPVQASAPRPFVDVSAPVAPAPEAEPLVGQEANDSDVVDEAQEEQAVEYDDGVQDEPSNVFQLPQAQAIALAGESQVAAMMNELNRAGHRTIAAKRKAAKEFVGRELDGPHQMTADEADAFINHLMRQAAESTAAVDAAWGITNTEEGQQ